MGVMKVLLLLLLLIFNFSFLASFANNLDSENSLEKMKDKQIEDSNHNSTTGDNNGIVNQSKFAHVGARGGGGGHPIGESNNGNGGQATSSQQGGSGVAVIPVYAAAGAGAAANHRRNHNGTIDIYGRCRKGRLMIVIFTALLLLISI
ncbi:hypothetical protein L6452_14082 [Arctium lappa]|uniref:Uncharacterized protein n=1 Tax=Arctium lappa TaxID=4217 RepID=A0ACB9CK30_ARCLA|nr:hypothetical protein L6452_14082 [Arctium lappa]